MSADHGTAAGDELLEAANMVFDRRAVIAATPAQVWPWLVQLGKRRAGWYLPAHLERLIPPARRASRMVEPRWQTLARGERVPDYGGRDEWLEVARIEPPHALVYRSERRGAQFTWALLLRDAPDGATELRLRFRGRLRSTGPLRRAIVTGGDFFDWLTGELMIRGLRERLAFGDGRR